MNFEEKPVWCIVSNQENGGKGPSRLVRGIVSRGDSSQEGRVSPDIRIFISRSSDLRNHADDDPSSTHTHMEDGLRYHSRVAKRSEVHHLGDGELLRRSANVSHVV